MTTCQDASATIQSGVGEVRVDCFGATAGKCKPTSLSLPTPLCTRIVQGVDDTVSINSGLGFGSVH